MKPLATDKYNLYVVQAVLKSDDRIDAFNTWYDKKHIPDLLTVPGINSGQRFTSRMDPLHYVATYEISGPEVFAEDRYTEVTGWGEWLEIIRYWDAYVYEFKMKKAGS